MRHSLVSVIVPVYNRAAQLCEAVRSAARQDYRPIEIIIVDDGSTDDTAAVAETLRAEHPDIIRVVSQANAGPGVAREHGRQLARGEFIQYLDSDDVLLPGKFTAQVEALRSMPSACAAYGITHMRSAGGQLGTQPHKKTGEHISTMFPEFLSSRWWETATPLYRRSVTDRAGAWSRLSLEEDWEYDCRIASLGGQLVWVPQPVSEHRDHVGTRLSRGAALDKARLAQRSQAHQRVYEHAVAYGLTPDSAHMQRYSRSLFLLARQCGAAGLVTDSQALFDLARRAGGPARARALDFRVYAAGARVVGWTLMGKLSCRLDAMKP